MPTPNDQLRAVLEAGEALLAAREDDMLTTQEWDDLEHAVAAATEPSPADRSVTFAIEDGRLVRRLVPTEGEARIQRCPRDVFEMIAAAAEEMGLSPFTVEDLRALTSVPWTQAAVALAFLSARRCVFPGEAHRYSRGCLHMFDAAMAEYEGLLPGHGTPPSDHADRSAGDLAPR